MKSRILADDWPQENSRYRKSKPYKGTLRTIDYTIAVWVNATADCNLTVAGVVPHTTSIHLQEGWNLVGFTSFRNSYTVAELEHEINAARGEAF